MPAHKKDPTDVYAVRVPAKLKIDIDKMSTQEKIDLKNHVIKIATAATTKTNKKP